jgi:hypothetical protein
MKNVHINPGTLYPLSTGTGRRPTKSINNHEPLLKGMEFRAKTVACAPGLREHAQLCSSLLHNSEGQIEEFGLIPHGPALRPLGCSFARILPANSAQQAAFAGYAGC